jgi:leucyl aminopeptidase
MTDTPISFHFVKSPSKTTSSAVGFVFEDLKLDTGLSTLDKKTDGLLKHTLASAPQFKGKSGQTLSVTLPPTASKALGLKRLVLAGLGPRKENLPRGLEDAGGKLWPALKSIGAAQIALLVPDSGLTPAQTAHFLMGMKLRAYHFDRYKTPAKKDKDNPALSKIEIVSAAHKKIEDALKPLSAITQGVYTARDLVNEPPNVLYPESYALRIRDLLKPLGVTVEILDEKKMEKLGMGAILAVGMGSARKPRIVVMHWNGTGRKTTKPVALVGKGVTFDTGGISIKPSGGMEEMKMDMGGSAAVVGAIQALALRKSKSNVVGIVGLAENMPSDAAYRPSDIVTSYAGKTIEIMNTDAEGRLVLADILTYVQKTYSPGAIIDLATLTGAMMVALGHEYCGTFVTDDKLWKGLEKASAETGEKLWRMPLDEVWKQDMEGSITDLQNLGKSGRYAGACTAAGFLQHFIQGDTPWAHLDIAGTAWIKKDRPTVPKNGSGFGVRVLDRLIANHYEG